MPKVKEKESGIEKFVNSVVDTKGSKAKSVEFFKDALKEVAGKDKIEIKKFIRFKVGEGIKK